VPRLRAAGVDLDADISTLGVSGLGTGAPIIDVASGTIWGNFAQVAAFFSFLLVAIMLRKRPDVHKRLMLIASISISLAAIARISRWPIFGGEQSPFTLSVFVALLGALVGYDLYSTRRVHPATFIGIAVVVAMAVAGGILGGSEFGRAFVRGL